MCNNKFIVKASVAVLLISLFVIGSDAAAFYTRPKVHPDFPMKCYWPEMLDFPLTPGNRVTGKGCVRLTCLPNFVVLGSTCPQMEDVPENMECVEVPGDENQAYPSCCPRLKCVQKIEENELF